MKKEEEEKDEKEGREKGERENERQAGTLKEREGETERKERKGSKNGGAKAVSRELGVCLNSFKPL